MKEMKKKWKKIVSSVHPFNGQMVLCVFEIIIFMFET